MRHLISLFILVVCLSITDSKVVSAAESVDRDTQRHEMHSCPIGQFVVGVHVANNLLLCSADFGDYSEAQEIIDFDTQFEGMHACPNGMAMTGLHVDRNLLACAPVANGIPRFVDSGTQRSGMHACPPGNPASGIHVDKNRLLCGTTSTTDTIDHGTQRHEMHSCPIGQFVVGVHVANNLLLCSADFGDYSEAQEIIDSNTEFPFPAGGGIHDCPNGMAMTGLHVARNLLACAPVANRIPRFVDSGTQRSGMHACPPGNPASGIHVEKNLLLCGNLSPPEPQPILCRRQEHPPLCLWCWPPATLCHENKPTPPGCWWSGCP